MKQRLCWTFNMLWRGLLFGYFLTVLHWSSVRWPHPVLHRKGLVSKTKIHLGTFGRRQKQWCHTGQNGSWEKEFQEFQNFKNHIWVYSNGARWAVSSELHSIRKNSSYINASYTEPLKGFFCSFPHTNTRMLDFWNLFLAADFRHPCLWKCSGNLPRSWHHLPSLAVRVNDRAETTGEAVCACEEEGARGA